MERLGIVVAVDGTLETTNGFKLTSQAAQDLARELDGLNGKTNTAQQGQKAVADANKTVASTSQEAAKGVAQLGKDLAQGDFKGAALQVGELALRNQALMGSMLGVGGLIGAAVIGISALGYAALQGAEQQRQLNDTLILTGNYAGLIAGELDTMAASVSRNISGTVGNSREVLAGLTATGKFTVMSLEEVASAAQLVARFTGQTNDQVVKQFASMGDGVTDWAAKTNSSYHFLSIETFRYIKQLEEQGRTQDAIRVTSEALSNHLGGNLTNNLGTLSKAWQGVQTWASAAWSAMMGVGKTETTQEKIDTITARLNYLATQKNSKGWTSDQKAQATAALESERAVLEADLRQERQLAARRSETAQSVALQIEEDQKKKKKAGRSPAEKEDEAQRRLVAETAGLSPTFTADWDRLTEVQRRNGLTVEWLTDAQAKLLAKQPGIRAEAQAQATALRELTQLRERNNQHMEREFSNQERELDGLAKTNDGLREQAAQVGLTKTQLGELKAVRLDALIAQERENLIVAESNDAGERQLELMRRKISLLEQQRGLTQELTAKTDAAEKTKAQEDASKKFGEDVRRDLKDGIIRGFEAGKSPAQALGDTLGNIVKQRLLSAFADSILNGFEPLIKQVLGNIRIPGLGGGGAGDGGGDFFGSILNTALKAFGVGDSTALPTGDFAPLDRVAAKGDAFGGGNVYPFARGGTFTNTVVNSPTLFKFAQGTGLMGEAGPEAILPLRRGADGSLGVSAGGGTSAPQVIVNVFTLPGTTASVKQSKAADGGLTLDVVIQQIGEALADGVAAGSGALAGAIEGRYGLRTAVG